MTAATFLDPRFKDIYLSPQEKGDAKSTILTFLRHRSEQEADERTVGVESDNHDQSSTSDASTGSDVQLTKMK